MKEFKTVLDLTCNLHLIPQLVGLDVLKRIVDWLSSSEATIEDEYVVKQLKYASQFLI